MREINKFKMRANATIFTVRNGEKNSIFNRLSSRIRAFTRRQELEMLMCHDTPVDWIQLTVKATRERRINNTARGYAGTGKAGPEESPPVTGHVFWAGREPISLL